MSQRLVKTIRATQVRSIGRPSGQDQLTDAQIERLTGIAGRFSETIALRRAGLTPAEIERLTFHRWRLTHAKTGRA